MNKVILVGNFTRDPETRYSQSSEPVAICRFTLAVNKRFKRENEPDADFINCVALGKTGEFVDKYFTKGRKIGVVGRLSVRAYEDQGQKKYWTEVVVEEAHFVDSKPQSGASAGDRPGSDDYYVGMASSGGAKPAAADFSPIDENIDDEELPF